MSSYVYDARNSSEYYLIRWTYEGQRAKRSGRLYVHHIHEGLACLNLLNISEPEVYKAFALHPICQVDDLLERHLSQVLNFDPKVIFYAMEYRHIANSFLPPDLDKREPNLSPIYQVNQMLIADKIQNYKDLTTYNLQHPNYTNLERYFLKWFELLEVRIKDVKEYIEYLRQDDPDWDNT